MAEYSNNYDTQDQSTAKEWFEAVPSNQAPLPPGSNHSHKKLFSLILVIFTGCIVLGSLIFLAVHFFMPVAKSCLNNTDFARLSGSTSTDKIDARTGLYTYTSEFGASNTYALDDTTSDFISTLAKLYSKRAKDASIVITVSSDYLNTNDDTKESANQRIKTITDQLVAAGVPASVIQTTTPKDISQDNEEAPQTRFAYIRVSSDSKCRL